jgi:signal transduction histidine kinase
MNTQQTTQQQLVTLADHLRHRRAAILDAWRMRVNTDPDLTTGSSLSRTLFNDHIPDILDSFERRLQAWPEEINAQVQQQEDDGMAAHGLHRWQQGFRLRELTREWGYLQLCVVDELEGYAHKHSDLEPTALATALRALTHLCVAGVSDSTEQYWQLQQAEAAGRLRELEQALVTINEIETARAAGWHQATHDLRGGVSVVLMASTLLGNENIQEPDRQRSATILQKGVSSLHDMLENLINLARLDAGHEKRTVAPFDAAALLSDFCLTMQPAAQAHGLSLKGDGLRSLPVEGDRTKVLRIIQNLVLNALKYTKKGGIIVTWETSQESDAPRWMISVQDTGPGFDGEEGRSVLSRLRDATQAAQQVEDKATASGTSSNLDEPAVTLASQSPLLPPSPLHQQSSQGIGLSIVKALCDLLDATLEVETSRGQGSTFRVTFPCSYAQ